MTDGPSPLAPPVPPLRVAVVSVTPFQQNCTLIWCTATMRAAIVDPGGDLPRIEAAIAHHGVTPEKILITHDHIDHCGEAAQLAARLSVPIEGPHRADRPLIETLAAQGANFGMAATPFVPDRWLEEGDTVTIGDLTLDVYFTPGHAPGHVIFHHPPSRFAQVGDVLFKGSIGRTDLPGGDLATLVRSVVDKLWPLGDDTMFVPGHGPTSTFGEERRANPYVSDAALG